MTEIAQNIVSGRSAKIGGGLAIAAALLFGLNGCATPANPAAMAVAPPATVAPLPAQLQHAMCVRSVTGGEATNPLWTSQVGDADFKTALSSSLTSAGLAASPDACHYQIDANLLGLSQPFAGLHMTVTSHVNYKVYDQAGTAASPSRRYRRLSRRRRATRSWESQRMRLANEGSIRTRSANSSTSSGRRTRRRRIVGFLNVAAKSQCAFSSDFAAFERAALPSRTERPRVTKIASTTTEARSGTPEQSSYTEYSRHCSRDR